MGKYIDTEKLIALIDAKLKDLGLSGSVWVGRNVLCELKDEIKSLQQEQPEKPVPNDLEEAAEEYEKKHTYQRYDGGGLTPEYNATLAEAVIFGAKCQKEQMMKEAVEGQVFGATDVKALYEGKVYVISNLVQDTDYNLYPNDKVRIIIVKE